MPERAKEFPKTDKGWQAYLQNTKPPEQREWHALGGGLTICLEPSGAKTFQARVRRRGDKAARRTRIGSFPAVRCLRDLPGADAGPRDRRLALGYLQPRLQALADPQ